MPLLAFASDHFARASRLAQLWERTRGRLVSTPLVYSYPLLLFCIPPGSKRGCSTARHSSRIAEHVG